MLCIEIESQSVKLCRVFFMREENCDFWLRFIFALFLCTSELSQPFTWKFIVGRMSTGMRWWRIVINFINNLLALKCRTMATIWIIVTVIVIIGYFAIFFRINIQCASHFFIFCWNCPFIGIDWFQSLAFCTLSFIVRRLQWEKNKIRDFIELLITHLTRAFGNDQLIAYGKTVASSYLPEPPNEWMMIRAIWCAIRLFLVIKQLVFSFVVLFFSSNVHTLYLFFFCRFVARIDLWMEFKFIFSLVVRIIAPIVSIVIKAMLLKLNDK